MDRNRCGTIPSRDMPMLVRTPIADFPFLPERDFVTNCFSPLRSRSFSEMRTRQGLQRALESRFSGSRELAGLPLRTRSKKAKVMVCEALGLPVRDVFKKTSPRFPEENLDVSVQKASNFQLWNAELDPNRRYAFLLLDASDRVVNVRVVTGEEIALFATTGTQTLKHQARISDFAQPGLRVIGEDTSRAELLVSRNPGTLLTDPSLPPGPTFLSLAGLGEKLAPLLGQLIYDPGADQERLRGQALHELVERALGYFGHQDSGQHPDIPVQLLELKLQTAATIDLGLVDPSSTGALGPPFPDALTHADIRYAIFGGVSTGKSIRIVSLTLVSGARFFEVFRRFEGLGVNRKIQIRLPKNWWG